MAGKSTRSTTSANRVTKPATSQKKTTKTRQPPKKLSKYEVAERSEVWTRQYYLGKSSESFPGIGCGRCSLISPITQFTSPFSGFGRVEVSDGLGEDAAACLRLSRGPEIEDTLEFCQQIKRNKLPDYEFDIFIVPFQNIDSVTLNPSTVKDNVYGVTILVGSSDANSGAAAQPTQPITFQWPKGPIVKKLEGYASEDDETSLDVLVRVLNKHLHPLQKEVNASLLEVF